MATNSEIRKDVLNRMVICDQSRGRIKYVGPIHGLNNDSGENLTFEKGIFIFIFKLNLALKRFGMESIGSMLLEASMMELIKDISTLRQCMNINKFIVSLKTNFAFTKRIFFIVIQHPVRL